MPEVEDRILLIEDDWQDFDEPEAPPPRRRKLPPDPTSFSQWLALYYREVVERSRSPRTAAAKRRDLEDLAGFVLPRVGDDVEAWTPALTAAFQADLARTLCPATQRPYRPATINRVVATARHFGRWLHRRFPLPGGDPAAGVKARAVRQRPLRELPGEALRRLREAAAARVVAARRRDQDPWLEVAVLELLLGTGLTPVELAGLKLSQLKGDGLSRVVRRGRQVDEWVPLYPRAQRALTAYLDARRGRRAGPLLRSRRGGPLATRDVARALDRLVAAANAGRPRSEALRLSPRDLRRHFLAKSLRELGPEAAAERSGTAVPPRALLLPTT